MGLMNDMANGNADPAQMMSVLGQMDSRFWKGAIMGMLAALVLNNESVKNAIMGTFSGVFAAFERENQQKQE